jgi:hypothetical protein
VPIALGRWCGRAHGPLIPWFIINTTKAQPMSLNTWLMTLTARTDKPAVLAMRNYLRQRGIVIPMRDRDVVAKYLHRIIENGNARTGIDAFASVARPAWPSAADQQGFERDARSHFRIPHQFRSRLQRLGIGSFGLLVLLACYIAFAG